MLLGWLAMTHSSYPHLRRDNSVIGDFDCFRRLAHHPLQSEDPARTPATIFVRSFRLPCGLPKKREGQKGAMG
jgi:hypothetical protein